MAKSTIWIFVASVLRTMEIGKVCDEDGVEVVPCPEYTYSAIS